MRTVSRLLAPLVALALIALAVLVSIEVVAAGLHDQPLVIDWHGPYRAGSHDTWADAGPLVISSVIAAVGLLLLGSQLTRRRVRRRALSELTPGVEAALSTDGLRTLLRSAATGVDGIGSAKVGVGRRTASVTASSRGQDPETANELTRSVERAVTERLDRAALCDSPRTSVRVRPGKDRR